MPSGKRCEVTGMLQGKRGGGVKMWVTGWIKRGQEVERRGGRWREFD